MKIIKKISIGNLFKLCGADNKKYYEEQDVPFPININTPSGLVPIRKLVKKNNIKTYAVNIDGNIVVGADKHRIKYYGDWRFLDSFNNKEYIGELDLYDVSVDSPHEYLTTNGIIHHNTTLAKILCNDIGATYKYINVSSESGIDTLRSEIATFASMRTIDGQPKIVIMDEFDGASAQLQSGMRAFIEEFHNSCRFIFTCNFKSKIMKPLQEGRVMEFNFDMINAEVTKEMKPKVFERILFILDNENIKYDKKVIAQLVNIYYPNIRKVISLIQKYSQMNGIIDANVFNIETLDDEFFEFILNKEFDKARKYVIEKSLNYDEIYTKMYKQFIPLLNDSQKPNAILIVADYMYKQSFVIDPEINFSACLIELMAL